MAPPRRLSRGLASRNKCFARSLPFRLDPKPPRLSKAQWLALRLPETTGCLPRELRQQFNVLVECRAEMAGTRLSDMRLTTEYNLFGEICVAHFNSNFLANEESVDICRLIRLARNLAGGSPRRDKDAELLMLLQYKQPELPKPPNGQRRRADALFTGFFEDF